MGQIIEFPDIKKLKEEICELKNDLENLVMERDNLLYVICENIKTAYFLEFGTLEHGVYKAYCKYLRLRRKKELIQAKINRKEKVLLNDIESKLDVEFIAYKKKLDDIVNDINVALKRSRSEKLTEDEQKEIKKLYRRIVKILHPDLNPKISDSEKELFYSAVESYERGDLYALQMIFDISCNGDNKENTYLSMEELWKEKDRLKNLIKKILLEINQIKENPPYSLKIFLENDDKKSEKSKELREELKSFNEAIRTEEESINELINEQTNKGIKI